MWESTEYSTQHKDLRRTKLAFAFSDRTLSRARASWLVQHKWNLVLRMIHTNWHHSHPTSSSTAIMPMVKRLIGFKHASTAEWKDPVRSIFREIHFYTISDVVLFWFKVAMAWHGWRIKHTSTVLNLTTYRYYWIRWHISLKNQIRLEYRYHSDKAHHPLCFCCCCLLRWCVS